MQDNFTIRIHLQNTGNQLFRIRLALLYRYTFALDSIIRCKLDKYCIRVIDQHAVCQIGQCPSRTFTAPSLIQQSKMIIIQTVQFITDSSDPNRAIAHSRYTGTINNQSLVFTFRQTLYQSGLSETHCRTSHQGKQQKYNFFHKHLFIFTIYYISGNTDNPESRD